MLTQYKQNAENIAVMLYRNEEQEGLSQFAELSKSVGELSPDEFELETYYVQFVEYFKQAVEAYNHSDVVGVADALLMSTALIG